MSLLNPLFCQGKQIELCKSSTVRDFFQSMNYSFLSTSCQLFHYLMNKFILELCWSPSAMCEVLQALCLKSAEDCVFPLLTAWGAHSGCLSGQVWSSKVSAFHDSAFPSLQECSGFLFPGCFTCGFVQVQSVWMDLADWWTRLLTAFIALSPLNCISCYFYFQIQVEMQYCILLTWKALNATSH